MANEPLDLKALIPHEIPDPAIGRWLAIPEDRPIDVPLLRSDIDHLFFSIRHLQTVTNVLSTACVYLAEGKNAEAKAEAENVRLLIVQSADRLSLMMESLMTRVKVFE